MTTREQICARCDEYVAAVTAHDTDRLVRLFAPDASQTEPVGTPPNVGHDAIRKFFAQSEGFPFEVRRIGPITVSGDTAAFQIRVDFPGGTPDPMSSTDVVTFDDEGRIASLVAIPDGEAHPDKP